MKQQNISQQNDQSELRKQASYVSFLFKQKVQPIANLTKFTKKGTALYTLQTEFSYLIHELTNGYVYRRYQVYTSIIDFINKIEVDKIVSELSKSK